MSSVKIKFLVRKIRYFYILLQIMSMQQSYFSYNTALWAFYKYKKQKVSFVTSYCLTSHVQIAVAALPGFCSIIFRVLTLKATPFKFVL